jgi:hypothetical protein
VEKDFHLYRPTIFVPHDLCHRTALSNYVFGSSQSGTPLLMMSPVSIMNHFPKPNIEHYWNANPGADPERGRGTAQTRKIKEKQKVAKIKKVFNFVLFRFCLFFLLKIFCLVSFHLPKILSWI